MSGVLVTDSHGSPTRYWCLSCRSYIASPYAHICQERTMQVDPTTVPTPQPSLRKAACEALLAGGLLLSDAQRDSANWQQTCMARTSEERFRKALEQLAEALAQ